MKRLLRALAVTALLAAAKGQAAPSFLDLTAVTAGSNGAFSGSIGGVAVTGTVTVPAPAFTLRAAGAAASNSVITGDSPQYSHAGIYTPGAGLADLVAYSFLAGSVATATLQISFASPVADLVLHFANLDRMVVDLAGTAGLGSLTLLSGNGGGGDGLMVSGSTIRDADPLTGLVIDPATAPPLTGARSAYGSVLLGGSYSTITLQLSNLEDFSDGGSFTFSATPVPEPSILACTALGMLALAGVRRRRAGKADRG